MSHAAERSGRSRLDPRYYADRLEMIRRIEVAFPDVTNAVETPWHGHPHAGIDVQTRWQLESGRALLDDEGRATGWWAGVNYTLSVWPLLIAREHFDDLRFDVEVRHPRDARFDVEECVVDPWLEYFRTLRGVERRRGRGELDREALRRWAPRLQQLLWDAHLDSVRIGRRRHAAELGDLPLAERTFASTWGETTVEFLAALNFPTDELVSGYANDLLPGFILRGRRIEGPANELTRSQRTLLRQLTGLHSYERDHAGSLLGRVREIGPILRESGIDGYAYGALRSAILDGERADLTGLIVDVLHEFAERRASA